MTNKTPKTRTKDQPSKKWFLGLTKKKLLIIVAIIIAVILIDTFITGIGKYAYTVVRCGRMPVETVPRGFIVPETRSGYILPGDYGYTIAGAGNNYYCTQAEAEAEGMTVDPLTKESLRQDGKH